jgi:thioredoxin 1
MQELRTKAEYLKASNADGTVILQATATWCSQCKAIAPFVDKLIAKYPEAAFYKYDTDSAGDIAQELGVSQRGAKAKALEEAVGKVYKGRVVEE